MSGPLPLTFGVRVPNSGPHATAANIELVADAADRLGFSTLWVHDHIPWASEMLTHFSTGSIEACDGQDPCFFETTATVAHLAARHPSLDVGIAGLVLPLRDPRVLAKQLMTTQSLTGGRLVTALAIGNVPGDFEVMQVPFRRRGRITDEHLAALAAIYGDERSSFAGERVAFADAEFFPKAPARFWIAGNSDPAYRRIADHAEGWLPGGLSPQRYADDLGHLAAVLEARGRDLAGLHRGTELFCCLADSVEEARAIAARSLASRFPDVDSGMERNLVGDPGRVLDQVEAFRRAGVTHFELRVVAHTIEDHVATLERFAAEVVPHAARHAAF